MNTILPASADRPDPRARPAAVELHDVQALLKTGFGRHKEAVFLLLRVEDRAAARAWLTAAEVTSALDARSPPDVVLQVALTADGLTALGVPDDVIEAFPAEFLTGMDDPDRARRLGDVGDSAPCRWRWGAGSRRPHVLLLLYALPGKLAAGQREVLKGCTAGFDVLATLDTADLDRTEPFGFVDGLSDPRLDWARERPVEDRDRTDDVSLACLGEFLLGHPNEYGRYTDRPLLDPARDAAGALPRAEDAPDRADLGRNGSYLVLRQLGQDVAGFWQYLDRQAGGDAAERRRLAETMVGRTMDGVPLVLAGGPKTGGPDGGRAPVPAHGAGARSPARSGGPLHEAEARVAERGRAQSPAHDGDDFHARRPSPNAFTYRDDPDGLRCPLGAHIRRANPRNADLPPGATGIVSRVVRVLGFDAEALRLDRVASTRFHRLLRRGRKYGPAWTVEQALAAPATAMKADTGHGARHRAGGVPEAGLPADPGSDRYATGDATASTGDDRTGTGIHFVGLCANIVRQFEFVQTAWLNATTFDRLHGESDPLLGDRVPTADGHRTDAFSMPRADGPDARLEGLPRFVTVVGGAYFFLPGLRALRYLATAARDGAGTHTLSHDRQFVPAFRPPNAATPAHAPPDEARPMATRSNVSRPAPPANTGSALLDRLADFFTLLMHLQRRVDPFMRPAFDALLRDPIARSVTALINARRTNEHLALTEERPIEGEEQWLDSIIASFDAQMRGLWKPGSFERGGNTKTHGIVRAEFVVHDGLTPEFRHGVFAEPRSYPAWVRFSGPGPYITPDIEDVGFMSISIKLMGVPGPKLMEEEKFTQDFFGVSTPTFVTPDTKANAQLQIESLKNAQIYYFFNRRRSHVLDFIMQALWTKTQSSPFEAPYFSCVPYLLGGGQAMVYSVWPTTSKRTPVPRLPLRPPDDYLRNAMVAALAQGDVNLDFRIQLQTDPYLMPIENAAVLWPERLSPRVSVATIRIPKQVFNSPGQMEFAKKLSYNPWHCIAEHRPLGNQSRARKRMYATLSALRHGMNKVPHYEPTGGESFPNGF